MWRNRGSPASDDDDAVIFRLDSLQNLNVIGERGHQVNAEEILFGVGEFAREEHHRISLGKQLFFRTIIIRKVHTPLRLFPCLGWTAESTLGHVFLIVDKETGVQLKEIESYFVLFHTQWVM